MSGRAGSFGIVPHCRRLLEMAPASVRTYLRAVYAGVPYCLPGLRLNPRARAVRLAGQGWGPGRLSAAAAVDCIPQLGSPHPSAPRRATAARNHRRLQCRRLAGYLTLHRRSDTLLVVKRSVYAWPRNWARTCVACVMSWTSPPSACTPVTMRGCWARCTV